MASKAGHTADGLMDATWVKIQRKTFTKWCNGHMIRRFGNKPENVLDIEKMHENFENGIMLMKLVNALYDTPFPARYSKAPKMKPQMLDNVTLAMKMLEVDAGVKTNFLKPLQLVDHDEKMILGMIWSIILDYQIKGISVEEMSAREGLLRWCQRKTAGYKDVKVDNFTTSWVDGLAFCALLHAHRPGLIDFNSLSKENKKENLKLAFDVAEKQLGIMPLLDVEDIVDVARPDEKSIITYVSEWFHYFASQNQAEVASRRIAKVLKLTQQNDALKQEYEKKSTELVEWIKATIAKMNDRNFDNTLAGATKNMECFQEYKKNEKPPKLAEKIDIEQVFANLSMKLRAAQRPAFVPATSPAELNDLWRNLEQAESERDAALRQELQRQLKLQSLVAQFNHKASQLVEWANVKQRLLDSLKGEVFTSVNQVQVRQKIVAALDEQYAASVPRVNELKDLGAAIIAENYEHKDQIQAKLDEIDALWDKLAAESKERANILAEEVVRQQKMDEARKHFARLISSLHRWLKDQIEDAGDHNFGNTLEAVEAYRAQMEAHTTQIGDTYTQKKAELDKALEELNALGVKDNKYTLLAVGDIDGLHAALQEAFAKRVEAYEAELARQKMMEEKRLAFAAAAKEFMEYIAAAKKKVLEAAGEPEEQIAFVNGVIGDGAEGKAKLDALDAMENEMRELGISHNRHTDLNCAILRTRWNQLNSFIANYLTILNGDLDMKQKIAAHQKEWEHNDKIEGIKIEFAKVASELNQWLQDSVGVLGMPISCNSVEGANKLLSDIAEIEKQQGAQAGPRGELAQLAEQLKAEGVNENALAEISLEQADAKLAVVGQLVTKRRGEAQEELTKQENHEALRKAFAEHAHALNSFLDKQLEAIKGTSGEIDEQLEQLAAISTALHEKDHLGQVVADDRALIDNVITENAHTTLTLQDLEAKWKLTLKSIEDKRSLLSATLEQQKGSEVSEEQLKELRDCFGHFDKDQDGVFTLLEFKACVSSLGEDVTEEEARKQCPDGKMTFAQYVDFMRARLADTASQEEINKSFKVLAADKPFVTDVELKNNFDDATYQYMIANMPKVEGGYDYQGYTGQLFSR
eukprot:TRINITY_DN5511_c0_g1_i1.p1 TRINITY_DN5511_c0_g1~~TRINITY_DN5511_c0_g1_i1.p1  ORF type:complete len:1116 (+),score=406.44 TRINITY_DN5511_c0_g1_i1:66-3350(+)